MERRQNINRLKYSMLVNNILQDERSQALVILDNKNLINGVSTRIFGNMSLVYGDISNALNNRENFLRELNVDYRNLVAAKQVHGAKILRVTEKHQGRGAISLDGALPGIDALITDVKGLPLAIFTADCLSIFIYDSQSPAIGLVHAGWQGTGENILGQAIGLMKKEFSSRAENLSVGFGPAIRTCCYEVGKEFQELFSYGLIERDKRYFLDLAGINKKQAIDAGVRQRNIFDSQVCTFCCNRDFFSFRREGSSCGRMISVAMLPKAKICFPLR